MVFVFLLLWAKGVGIKKAALIIVAALALTYGLEPALTGGFDKNYGFVYNGNASLALGVGRARVCGL